ncbi:autotransporter domain-containing protein [Sandaracinobacteroides hominis]|uniref:autotransporter domain-containing protein n=1 Tax=Sandaracinobacteroides hominis TaxID=2780086 RepID=UPI0018F31A59|nr:autotransporter domain-containing protein [Sandaracinobacteroides hominis]
MNKLRITAASLAMATALAFAGQASANTLYFQMNPNYSGGGQRQLFVFGPANSTGTVTNPGGFSEAFDLGAEGFATITLPNADELDPDTVQDLGYKVTSSAAVSGYFLSRQTATTDMTYLIDGERLGTKYVVAGYQNIYPDQMSVQATQDNTTVTFKPKGGAEFNVTLNAGQTYMYDASLQLTGSMIDSDKPIAVFSGNQCTNVPTGVGACDHIVEQMPSVDQLSTTYLVAQTPRTGTLGNVMRIVATEDATDVKLNGTTVATLNAGEFYEGRVSGGLQVDASKKVLVAQYLIGQGQANANTDPAMTIVPGADQWLSSYVFATPSGVADFPTDFVSIIIETSSLPTLTIDGTVADATLFNALGSTIYSYGNIDVSGTTGPFTISAETKFQLLLSGFDSYDSYFTFGGAAFAPGASPDPETPPPPPPSPTTDVYWDGDGLGRTFNGTVDGGDGILTRNSPNLTVDNGVTNNSLPLEPANVIFSVTPGTVTIDDVDGPISAAGARFLVSGYVINGDSVAMVGDAPTLQVGTDDDATAGFIATVNNVLTGEDGLTKSGKGTLYLNGVNTYSGGTTVSAGTLVGNTTSFGTGAIANNATLVFDQATDASFGAGINGSGVLMKQGAGRLTIEGTNGLTGGTWVNAGGLHVTGTLASSIVTVASGARLSGTGTVGGVVLQSGGMVLPGASIGTLEVAGNYEQAAGSVYEVELNSLGQSDLIHATGTATLAAGSSVNVVKLDSPRYVLGTRYTILSADGGLTGTYTTITGATGVSAFIGLTASYDATNAYLNVARTRSFASAGNTVNQIHAASGADNAGNGAMYTAIAYLPDNASAQYAFDQVSGEIHASLRGATLEDSRFIREAMINRTVGSPTPGKGLFFHAYGSWGTFDGDGNAADVKRDIGGFFIGGEMVNDSGLILGALAGYGEAKIKVSDRNSKADTADTQLGGYVGFNALGFTMRGGLAYMWRDVKTVRTPGFTGFSDTLTAKYNSNLFQLFGDAGYKIQAGGIGLEPFFQLAYIKLEGGDFSERGGSAALQGLGANSTNYWLTQLGSRFNVGFGSGGLGLSGSLGWRHLAGGDKSTPVSLGFASGPAFDIYGAPIAKDVAAMSLALTGKIGTNIDIDVGYSGQAGNGASDHGIRAAVAFRF